MSLSRVQHEKAYRSRWDLPMLILLYLVGVVNGFMAAMDYLAK